MAEKTLQTPQEVEKALGIKPGERLTDDSKSEPGKPAVQKIAQQTSKSEPQQQQAQPAIQPEQQRELTPDERAKMFQQKFSQEETERKKLEQELVLTNDKLNFITNVMSQFQQQPVQQVAQQPEVKVKEPDIRDFVSDYDPREGVQTTDPGYQQYLRAREDYRDKQLEDRLTKNISSKMEQTSRLEKIRANGEKLCEQYPEYRAPVSPQFPDGINWGKIKIELGAFVEGGDLIKAKEFVDFKAGKSTQPVKQQTDQSILEQIEQHAKAPNDQRIPSVTTSPGTSGNRNVELSEEGGQYQRIFGKL